MHHLYIGGLHVEQESNYKREVKTFSTKTSRNVGMVPSVSKEHMYLHGKSTGGKTSGTRRGTIPCSTIQVDILRHQRHSGYVFTIPTSGNICSCVYAHGIVKIELGKAIKKYKSSGHIAICQSSVRWFSDLWAEVY